MPGFWSASGALAGVRICDPAPSMTAAGSGLAPLPALPAAKIVPLGPSSRSSTAARPLSPLNALVSVKLKFPRASTSATAR